MTTVAEHLLKPAERSPSDFGDDEILYAATTYALRGTGIRARRLVPQEDLRNGGFGVRDVFAGELADAPCAFVALPFRRDEPAEIIVPAITVRSVPGSGDATGTTGTAQVPAAQAHGSVLRIQADCPPEEWCAKVDRLVQRLRDSDLEKAVLARRITVTGDKPFSRSRFLRSLALTFRTGVIYCFRDYLGASPELLVSRHGQVVACRPLAGTLPRGQSEAEDDAAIAVLLGSPQFQCEHQIVVRHIVRTLRPLLPDLAVESTPEVVTLANVHHLGTAIGGSCPPGLDVLRLAAELHPTPAVCGSPADGAYTAIGELEGWSRGLYAGAVGWVDPAGDGEFSVAIRGAELTGPTARVFVGNGIVSDSSPAGELAETRAKISGILNALVEP